MLRVCFVLIVLVLVNYNGGSNDFSYCTDIDIRVNITNFEKLRNCKVIAGNLQIVFFELAKSKDFENLTLPELVEVKGYVLFYRVYGLKSLTKLFPNLSIIRGKTLIRDYSLIFFDMPDLQEIGLQNLVYMPRGKVYIQKCPKLCHVDTINWKAIGTNFPTLEQSDSSENSHNHPKCLKNCSSSCDSGFCWSDTMCQKINENACPNDCCKEDTKSIAVGSCLACKHLVDNGSCVKKCPENKFRHVLLDACVTKEDCNKTVKGTWWTFEGKCVKSCPPGYQTVAPVEGGCKLCHERCEKWCHADVKDDNTFLVETISSAQNLGECTHINGSLYIRVDSKDVTEELVNHLGKIEEITGFLQISRSYHITSLAFLKSLKIIHGRVLVNDRYSLVVYENQNLRELWDWSNFRLLINIGTISFHYNPQLCLKEIEKLVEVTNLEGTYSDIDVTPDSNGDKTACSYVDLHAKLLEINPGNVTLYWDHFKLRKNDSLINYAVYYIRKAGDELTIAEGQDECSDEGWNSFFVPSNSAVIANLIPFTEYAFYIKMYVSTPSHGGQTKISYFRTAPDDPSPPRNIAAVALTSNIIRIKWLPPLYFNGNFSHYHVFGFLEPDDPQFILQRDYCLYPPEEYVKRPIFMPNTSLIEATDATTNKSECECPSTKTLKEEFELSCDSIVSIYSNNHESLMSDDSCKKFLYYRDNKYLNRSRQVGQVKIEDYKKENQRIDKIASANATSLDINRLRRFSLYVFFVSACNPNYMGKTQCSSPIMVFARTLKDEKSDDIYPKPTVTVDDDNVILQWQEPKNPNSVIVSYLVEHKKTDIENSKTIPECITKDDHIKNKFTYKLKSLIPGRYAVRVKAVSLAGLGNFGEFQEFVIDDDSQSTAWVLILGLASLIIVILVVILYIWYKKKHQVDMLHLIANINPDYAGPVYIEDEWEVDREDIEVLNPLGKGTFGMVYNGRIKSKNLPCAIKTVNENSKIHDRMEFLNEAAVMKSFSDAHHVVKLYGVVSRGAIPLVIMELMQRGDLKSYLRKSRDSSNSVNCAEMYRMAAEIADGMAYLAAKKFVHRDLAARNCMVSADRTVKIGDFGMTRDIYETDYYRKESRGLLPVRWMAPESLADGIFTSDSDVWSYGVVLWEMATLAEQPYQGLANEQVLQYVIAKGTLDRPPECPDLLYEIMVACWKWRPINRPQFVDIVEKLENNVGQDFRLVSFYHSREGEEYRLNSKERVYNMPALGVRIDHNSGVHWTSTSDDEVSISSDQPNGLLSTQSQSPNNSNFA